MQKNWPPKKGTYIEDPEKGLARPRCRHKTKPAEPFAKPREFGVINRVTPAARGIPAAAFVDWDGYSTWEFLTQLSPALSKGADANAH